MVLMRGQGGGTDANKLWSVLSHNNSWDSPFVTKSSRWCPRSHFQTWNTVSGAEYPSSLRPASIFISNGNRSLEMQYMMLRLSVLRIFMGGAKCRMNEVVQTIRTEQKHISFGSKNMHLLKNRHVKIILLELMIYWIKNYWNTNWREQEKQATTWSCPKLHMTADHAGHLKSQKIDEKHAVNTWPTQVSEFAAKCLWQWNTCCIEKK